MLNRSLYIYCTCQTNRHLSRNRSMNEFLSRGHERVHIRYSKCEIFSFQLPQNLRSARNRACQHLRPKRSINSYIWIGRWAYLTDKPDTTLDRPHPEKYDALETINLTISKTRKLTSTRSSDHELHNIIFLTPCVLYFSKKLEAEICPSIMIIYIAICTCGPLLPLLFLAINSVSDSN